MSAVSDFCSSCECDHRIQSTLLATATLQGLASLSSRLYYYYYAAFYYYFDYHDSHYLTSPPCTPTSPMALFRGLNGFLALRTMYRTKALVLLLPSSCSSFIQSSSSASSHCLGKRTK